MPLEEEVKVLKVSCSSVSSIALACVSLRVSLSSVSSIAPPVFLRVSCSSVSTIAPACLSG